MWVLSARENAEKIWYQFIWDKTEEASNVIDYNINEEITKDASAVFNANNDTTTGMANVIPWVNAPKLIAQTSIIWIDFNAGFQWWAYFRFSNSQSVICPPWENVTEQIVTLVLKRDERWPYDFKYVEWKWIIAPAQWTYELKCLYYFAGSTSGIWTFELEYKTFVWWKEQHTSGLWSDYEYEETFSIYAKKWQWIKRTATHYNYSSTDDYFAPWVWVTITKK